MPDGTKSEVTLPTADERCRDLFCLLRLSEIVIAAPDQSVALQAMVDELARLTQVRRALVALSEGDGLRLRYLAHRGLPGRTDHAIFIENAFGPAKEAILHRHLIQSPCHDEPGLGSLALPLLAGERALGVLGIDLRTNLPITPWAEEMLWAAADFVTLVLLGRSAGRGPGLRLTRRQSDVVFELVEHGASNEQIADRLGLSARTVKIHLQAAYRELGVRTRGEAIRLVLTRFGGWLEQERGRRRHPLRSKNLAEPL